MAPLLKSLPKIIYGNYTMSNILTRIAAIKSNLNKIDLYYPYVIRDGERPDTIGYDYYGHSDYAWLIFLANDIYDIYSQWPLDDKQFHQYLYAKYSLLYELKGIVSHYVYQDVGGNSEDDTARHSFKMTAETWSLLSVDEKSYWKPVFIYDYEYELNDNKRYIRLLSNEFLKQADSELETLLK